jgi:tetratricopeptide (TPR) repeat protein
MALLLKSAYTEAEAEFSAGSAAINDPDDLESARIGVDVGTLHFRRGDFAMARQALERAVDLGQRLGADDLVAEGLKQHGNVAFHTGDLKGAAEYYLRSRAIHERLENLSGIAEVRNNLGTVYRREAQWAQALAEYDACLTLWERIGNPRGVALSHNNTGEVHRSRGDLDGAIAAYERALGRFEVIGAATEAAIVLIGVGAARVEAGDVARGRADLLRALDRLSTLGSTGYLPDVYRYLASADLAEGNLDGAERAAEQSLEYARAGSARHQEAATLRVLGEIALARGEPDAALALLEVSRQTLRKLGDTLELARTEAVLNRLEHQD